MDDDAQQIDEVALNVLLAEGLDAPTAWEASRRDDNQAPAAPSCNAVIVLIVVACMLLLLISL
jgi:hypothetical protein